MSYTDSDSIAIVYLNQDTVLSIPIFISDDGSLHVDHAGKIVPLGSIKHRIEKAPQYRKGSASWHSEFIISLKTKVLKRLQQPKKNSKESEISINDLSAKLIIIDGKEASAKDLKKLSAADIKSMSSKTSDDLTKKYGDKAKNGVVFITTTKAK